MLRNHLWRIPFFSIFIIFMLYSASTGRYITAIGNALFIASDATPLLVCLVKPRSPATTPNTESSDAVFLVVATAKVIGIGILCAGLVLHA